MNEDRVLISAFVKQNKDLINKINNIEYGEDFSKEDDDEDFLLFDDELDISDLAEYTNMLIKHDKLLNIYEDLLDGFYFTSSVDLIDTVMILCKYYLSVSYSRNDFAVNFIKNNSLKNVYSFFKSNESFALTLLANYYVCKLNNYPIEERIFDEDEHISEYKCANKVMFITDHLRFLYEKCINELLECGLSQEDAIKVMYLALKGKEISLPLDIGIETISDICDNRHLITRLIYADLFEDVDNWMDTMPHYDELVKDITFNIATDYYSLPNSEISLLLLERFTDLIFDPITRERNRSELNQEHFKVLKKVNPFYQLERVMIGYENK